MNDPQLAAALRSRSPDALPELLDAYGDQLFRYCGCLFRNRENAQIAMRDGGYRANRPPGMRRMARLVAPFAGPCRMSAARGSSGLRCRRAGCLPNTDDADSRLMAWKAVTSMPADEVEALELNARHDVDLRLVLGLQPEPPAQRVPARVFALLPAPVRSSPSVPAPVRSSPSVPAPVFSSPSVPAPVLSSPSASAVPSSVLGAPDRNKHRNSPPAPSPMRVKQMVVAL
jgi:hypothetical protein